MNNMINKNQKHIPLSLYVIKKKHIPFLDRALVKEISERFTLSLFKGVFLSWAAAVKEERIQNMSHNSVPLPACCQVDKLVCVFIVNPFVLVHSSGRRQSLR